MKVVLAESAGTCYGVQRALDLANDVAAKGKPAQTFGPLIHNPRVVESLSAKGVSVANSPTDVTAHTVVLRSHGVLPETRRRLDAIGVDIVDATCPHVLHAQKAAQRMAAQGLAVVVVGEADHPEVEGLVAYAREEGARVVVVATPDDLPDDLPDSVGVVAQTTQKRAVFEEIVAALRARDIDPVAKDTICDATKQRQEAAEKLAREVDAVVVLGGRNSSNTTRLFEVCERVCPRSYHIEGPQELVPEMFEGCATVGVTAGASTPKEQIIEIICTLESF